MRPAGDIPYFLVKHLLLTTIAAVLLVGCGPSVDIWEAARTGNIEAVKQHLAAGTDVNAKTGFRWTPLHYAAREGHKEITDLLLTNGANVNAKNDEGGTPLDWAECCADKKEIVTSSANTAVRRVKN